MKQMQIVVVKGLASGKIVKKLTVGKMRPDLSLMDFLMENKITIASSCGGAGTCKKCVVNKNLLSCQISLPEFVRDNESVIVEVAYL